MDTLHSMGFRFTQGQVSGIWNVTRYGVILGQRETKQGAIFMALKLVHEELGYDPKHYVGPR
jgi:hypothetical protein